MNLVDQRRDSLAFGEGSEKAGLHVGGLINTRRNTVGNQVENKLLFTSRRRLEQLDQCGDLFGGQWFWRDALGGAFFDMLAIGFKHVGALFKCIAKTAGMAEHARYTAACGGERPSFKD